MWLVGYTAINAMINAVIKKPQLDGRYMLASPCCTKVGTSVLVSVKGAV
jgi:hypothetical protein